jgi:hypothetical protein
VCSHFVLQGRKDKAVFILKANLFVTQAVFALLSRRLHHGFGDAVPKVTVYQIVRYIE